MSITVSKISDTNKEMILHFDESHFIDVKSKDISPSKITRHLSAFANADAGELYIGVEEDKKMNTKMWNGFSRQEDANGHIQCFEAFFPLSKEYRYEFLECDGCSGYVLHIEISKSHEIKYASDSVNIGLKLPLFIGQLFPLFSVFGTFIPSSQRLLFSNDLSCGMSRL